jgi:hypothetical protein
MSPLTKNLLMAVVLAVVTTLAGALGISYVMLPGYLMGRLFAPLPQPYTGQPAEPHATLVLVLSFVFWLILFVAWAFILQGRLRSKAVVHDA